jgi:hypothetical protein
LERESGERMIERTGLLNFGNPNYVSRCVLAHVRSGASVYA